MNVKTFSYDDSSAVVVSDLSDSLTELCQYASSLATSLYPCLVVDSFSVSHFPRPKRLSRIFKLIVGSMNPPYLNESVEAVFIVRDTDDDYFPEFVSKLLSHYSIDAGVTNSDKFKIGGKCISVLSHRNRKSNILVLPKIHFAHISKEVVIPHKGMPSSFSINTFNGSQAYYLIRHELAHAIDHCFRNNTIYSTLEYQCPDLMSFWQNHYLKFISSEYMACIFSANGMSEGILLEENRMYKEMVTDAYNDLLNRKSTSDYLNDENAWRAICERAISYNWLTIALCTKLLASMQGTKAHLPLDLFPVLYPEALRKKLVTELKELLLSTFEEYPNVVFNSNKWFNLWLNVCDSHGYRFKQISGEFRLFLD